MSKLLAIALVAVLAAVTNAQFAPTNSYSCATPTGLNFCASTVTYTVANATQAAWSALESTAYSNYVAAFAKGAQNSTACTTALQTYYCQYAFPRCSQYITYSSIAQARCTAVQSTCNVTTFPTGFTGANCVANMQVTVDGSVVCAPATTGVLGSACTVNIYDPAYVSANSTFQSVACPFDSFCNYTSTSPVCLRPSNSGDACMNNNQCYNGPAMGGATTTLTCIAGTCQYTGKRFGYTCLNNAECSSNNCTSGTCYESPLGGACSSSLNCRQGLYCDMYNSTCYQAGNQNDPCGSLQTNWTPVPCIPTQTCVQSTNGTVSRCMPNAVLGATCSPTAAAIAYPSPLCVASTYGQNYKCVNNVCMNVLAQQLNQPCNYSTTCDPSLTCQYTTTGFSAQGVCVTPSSVSCGSQSGNPSCNTGQTCKCGTTSSAYGTCAVSTTVLTTCASQYNAYQTCLMTSCPGSASLFYDASSCGYKQCLASANAFVCCAQSSTANFVAPNGTPSNVCATPSPTPTPAPTGVTTMTPTGTGTPVPIQSSKKSGAANVAISFAAIFVAVVAFCL